MDCYVSRRLHWRVNRSIRNTATNRRTSSSPCRFERGQVPELQSARPLGLMCAQVPAVASSAMPTRFGAVSHSVVGDASSLARLSLCFASRRH